ncbi:bifunctional nicotinamidase/pyrazinamidase [Paenirhodobacter sp.]|uniref:bifunctional nicotinamidase/pyrazinamidase n=1 Tax=Paenirhodobacter sp. TaxID=1965326 RepID=UPI003B3C0B08
MAAATEALIVIDIQNDFCPGGALAVAGGDEIIPRVNALMQEFPVTVLTQDWHPEEHSSFAALHDAAPFSTIQMPYGPQTLWPVHCVWGSEGAAFHPKLSVDPADLILRKGFRPEVDSYSAFFENDHLTPTGLTGYLRERGITDLAFVGLAHDFCVAWSAIDAAKLGFRVKVLEGACRAIDLNGSLAAARDAMRAAGVVLAE